MPISASFEAKHQKVVQTFKSHSEVLQKRRQVFSQAAYRKLNYAAVTSTSDPSQLEAIMFAITDAIIMTQTNLFLFRMTEKISAVEEHALDYLQGKFEASNASGTKYFTAKVMISHEQHKLRVLIRKMIAQLELEQFEVERIVSTCMTVLMENVVQVHLSHFMSAFGCKTETELFALIKSKFQVRMTKTFRSSDFQVKLKASGAFMVRFLRVTYSSLKYAIDIVIHAEGETETKSALDKEIKAAVGVEASSEPFSLGAKAAIGSNVNIDLGPLSTEASVKAGFGAKLNAYPTAIGAQAGASAKAKISI